MSWIDGLTKNTADLEPSAEDPTLRPIRTDLPPVSALARMREILRETPLWALVEDDPASGTMHAVHATWFWRFKDDVHLRFVEVAGGTEILGTSQSRIGRADFGQNARNLRELARAFAARTGPDQEVR